MVFQYVTIKIQWQWFSYIFNSFVINRRITVSNYNINGKKISSYLPYLKVTLPPGEKLKVTFKFQAFQSFSSNEAHWDYYLFNSEHLVVNEGMNKLVKYDGYNSSTPDCITA